MLHGKNIREERKQRQMQTYSSQNRQDLLMTISILISVTDHEVAASIYITVFHTWSMLPLVWRAPPLGVILSLVRDPNLYP